VSGFLLDTNCISEVVRVKPEPRVLEWMASAEEGLLYLSILTLGEIGKGLASLRQGKRRTQLEAWLEVELQARFSGRIVPIDAAVADRWGLIAADAKRKGKAPSTIDALLAATALHYNLTIVSCNVSDFANTQVPILNPWEARPFRPVSAMGSSRCIAEPFPLRDQFNTKPRCSRAQRAKYRIPCIYTNS